MRAAFPVLLGVLSMSLAGAGIQTAARQPPPLSGKARDALNTMWPGWQVAAVDAAATACAPGAAAGPVAIDIDGDGTSDLALAVQTTDGVRLAVLIHRPWGYDLYDVDGLGTGSVSGYLAVTPRGTSYPNPRTSLNSYAGYDTVTLLRCDDAARTLYLWRGFMFEKIVQP